jgi:hypothetical protein
MMRKVRVQDPGDTLILRRSIDSLKILSSKW